jgi:sugar lactone lactonase YvrE
MADMHTLLTGLAFGESPRWHDGHLWVADWRAKEILAVDPDGNSEVIAKVGFPTFPMCFDWLPNGQLLLVSSREGLVLRMESGGSLVTHANLTGLAKKEFPWNEIVVDVLPVRRPAGPAAWMPRSSARVVEASMSRVRGRQMARATRAWGR